ncbi:MAG: TAT-variant-translocated molybdopterin oxidoreductase [Chloroherpetonaceae bacterium]|nr:TAT-variant-translocated molybdopterin oxidoreductase [Chloroherpetonaceae bacterium]
MKRIPELRELLNELDETSSPKKKYWRSLEQYADTPEFKEYLASEFPDGISDLKDPISRRKFLSIMGASIALAGLASCRRPVEKIVPYVKPPEEITPGIAQQYATVMPFGLTAYGLLVTSHEGRPTKIEGNKYHPSSLGGTNFFMQAEILSLYDPDRSQKILKNGNESSWAEFSDYWSNQSISFRSTQGEGLILVAMPFSSPTMARLLSEFKSIYPKAKIISYEAVCDENSLEGLKLATGSLEPLQPVYSLRQAKVILSLDSDFCQKESESVSLSRGFIDGRRVESQNDEMNRLYVVESSFSITGGMADHRLKLRPSEIGAFTAALILELTKQGLSIPISEALSSYSSHSFDQKWISSLAKDLLANKGNSVVIAGREQNKLVHALTAAINIALENNGKTVKYIPIADALTPECSGLEELSTLIESGKVETVLLFGTNPAYDAPQNLRLKELLKKVNHTVHCGYYNDETASISKWHLPIAHFLEMWGDARSADGTLGIIQPLIEPLYGSKTTVELLNFFTKVELRSGYELVRDTWKSKFPEDFENQWRRTLHDGILQNSSLMPLAVAAANENLTAALQAQSLRPIDASASSLEISFKPSTTLYDGRYSNNAWLQELPDPVTKITWDNAALISEKTAQDLGIRTVYSLSDYQKREMIRISFQGEELDIPVWVTPGHADNTITLSLGYGRSEVGRVSEGVGFNSYLLRRSDALNFGYGAKVTKLGSTYLLASTQHEGDMHDRPVVIESTLDDYRKNPSFVEEAQIKAPKVQLWEKPYKHDEGYQWGMVIDLNACTGCNACAIACQSENNIPVVGKEQVSRTRQMHWIRIDRYFSGDVENPQMVTQPVGCQHCENAPCESVCPVAATVHDEEGLNSMVYNRCVGTRYCANNCPYKVRRFNYFNYATDSQVWGGEMPELVKMAQNPEVTVRFRGVMEKCTYCTQRIETAKINAKNNARSLVDGEVVTACQQACPTQAIVFGNINDATSKVAQLKQLNREYKMLAEINVKPRTSYLAKLRNPNPELEKATV